MSQQEQKGNPQKQGPRIHAQLAAIMAAVEAVGKERRNTQQGFNFRGIEDVMNALHPIFAEHKVYVLSEIVSERTEERATKSGGNLIYRVLQVKVAFVSGEDGSRETVSVIGEGMDSGDKAASKAMSQALKYALSQTLILPFAQVDGDQDSQPESNPKPAAGAPSVAAAGKTVSAYDGRTLKPGESPLPPTPPAGSPSATPPAISEKDKLLTRLQRSMAQEKMEAKDLKAYLVSRGAMTPAMDLAALPVTTLALLLDGKHKQSGRGNWTLVCEGVLRMTDNLPFGQ